MSDEAPAGSRSRAREFRDSVGVYEAKTHLPALLTLVADGRCITITRHGRPVAVLGPVTHRGEDPAVVVARMRAARIGVNSGHRSAVEMLHEGRSSDIRP